MSLRVQWLGRIGFENALALQEQILQRKIDGQAGDELLLLEHEPVYTIGRTPDQTSLRGAEKLPHPVVRINRGGQATYHGPGQLVGYPILDLRTRGQDLHRYLRALEEILIETLRAFDIDSTRREGLTGVWVENRKIASIGVGVRRWITMHGFALNVCGDLSPFQQIIPCGISGVEMTSVARETGDTVEVDAVAEKIAAIFPRHLSKMGLQNLGGRDSVEPKLPQSHIEHSRKQGSTESRPPSRAEPGRKKPVHGVYISRATPTIVFVTFCTRNRAPWLASAQTHHLLTEAWRQADAWLVGRYVLMPDHAHFFCAPSETDSTLEKWMTFWKRTFQRLTKNPSHRFQTGHWDTRLRRGESYDEKWNYVRENPVRAGLAAHPDDWPYQGEIHALRW